MLVLQGEDEGGGGYYGSGDGLGAGSEGVDADMDSAMVELLSNMVENSEEFEEGVDDLGSVLAPSTIALGKRT